MSDIWPKEYAIRVVTVDQKRNNWKIKMDIHPKFESYLVEFLKNHPAVNSITMLQKSRTFVVRLQLFYAWDNKSAAQTVQYLVETMDDFLKGLRDELESQEQESKRLEVFDGFISGLFKDDDDDEDIDIMGNDDDDRIPL